MMRRKCQRSEPAHQGCHLPTRLTDFCHRTEEAVLTGTARSGRRPNQLLLVFLKPRTWTLGLRMTCTNMTGVQKRASLKPSSRSGALLFHGRSSGLASRQSLQPLGAVRSITCLENEPIVRPGPQTLEGTSAVAKGQYDASRFFDCLASA